MPNEQKSQSLQPDAVCHFYATTFRGLESMLMEEIESCNGHAMHSERGVVWFSAALADVMKLNYTSRLANKFVLVLERGEHITTFDEMYDKVRSVPWEKYFSCRETFAIESSLTLSVLNHSLFALQRGKDAVADRFKEKEGRRPDVNKDDPDIIIDIRIVQNKLSVGMNLTGQRLFKRGYRKETNAAPLKETLAAGIVRSALKGNEGKFKKIIDPMCGAGTLLIEAAMQLLRIPSGGGRNFFSFMKLRGYDKAPRIAFEEIVRLENAKALEKSEYEFIGCDHTASFLKIAEQNTKSAELETAIKFVQQDFFNPTVDMTKSLLIFNPPYGERMQGAEDLNLFYEKIGDTLKHHCQGSKAFIFTEFGEPMKHIGLKPNRRLELYNGKIECRLLEFDIF